MISQLRPQNTQVDLHVSDIFMPIFSTQRLHTCIPHGQVTGGNSHFVHWPLFQFSSTLCWGEILYSQVPRFCSSLLWWLRSLVRAYYYTPLPLLCALMSCVAPFCACILSAHPPKFGVGWRFTPPIWRRPSRKAVKIRGFERFTT